MFCPSEPQLLLTQWLGLPEAQGPWSAWPVQLLPPQLMG